MRFVETAIPGVVAIDLVPHTDDRGFFARTFCQREFAKRGLVSSLVQCNLSYNKRAGTLRGLHYQIPPASEAKLVRCTSGAIYDVVLDLRAHAPTYLQHVALELSARDRRAVYVPEGCAHGYQTLTDGVEVFYQVSAFYTPSCERGYRYDDPAFAIAWPLPVTAISAKDLAWPAFEPILPTGGG